MASRLTLRVVFQRDGTGWHARIPSVRGCLIWGRSLTAARRKIRRALSTCEDVFEDAAAVARRAELAEEVLLPTSVRRKLSSYVRERARAQVAQTRLRLAQAQAVEALVRDTGVSLRDAGELLGMAFESVRLVAATSPRSRT